MKKILIIPVLAISFFGIYKINEAYLNIRDEDVFKKLTGISKFEIIADIRHNHYYYLIANISSADKHKVLGQHYFRAAPFNLKGHSPYQMNFVKESDYLYYLEDSGHGYKGYVLYLVSKANNKIIVYTNYAD